MFRSKGCERGLTWIKPSFRCEWTVSITDVTPLAHRIHALVRSGELEAAAGTTTGRNG
ncbi:hypothetical protein [Streptomyces sp. NBC_00829]|uniref:hypothetical protein n=1 Tax=Streptomyces sp. NBC_00829 TaxID=2903679 RepID=UPI0038665675|nr:hypothetical protein OG293_23715 [Streptomyces sp. NBC_00829]